MKHSLTFLSSLCLAGLGLFLASGCKDATSSVEPKTYAGGVTTIGTGSAHTYLTIDGSGNLSAIGIAVTDAALSSLTSVDTMFELPLPSGFGGIPYKSVSLDQTVSDMAPYDKPHVDAHFYLLDMAHRMDIMAGMDTMMPVHMTLPDGFMRMGECEPMMGTHYIDMNGQEQHGQPFRSTFVYGLSKGSMVFMEAMCDKAALMNHTALSGTVRKPMMMSGSMMTPSTYQVTYDAATKTTSIELKGF